MLANGDFTYTPNANTNGSDSFTYRLLDGRGGVATGTVSLTVAGVNDAPSGTSKSISLTRSPSVSAVDMVFSETDFGFVDGFDSPANLMSGVRIASVPAKGSLTLSGAPVSAGAIISAVNIRSGLLKYAPATNGFGNNYAGLDFNVMGPWGHAISEAAVVNLVPQKRSLASLCVSRRAHTSPGNPQSVFPGL